MTINWINEINKGNNKFLRYLEINVKKEPSHLTI